MEKVYANFNFKTIERIMGSLNEDHSSSQLSKLKNEINKFFYKAKCKEIIFTNNTDKMFFGMRVYPLFDGNTAMEILGDNKTVPFEYYYIEFDSKLFNPLLALNEKELTAILLHEIGHVVYDTGTIDEVRKQVDLYFAQSNDYVDIKSSRGYRELIAYALKDSIMKAGSIFSKIGDDEMIADAFVASCGYGPYLESGMRKLMHSDTFLTKQVDDRFITLSWVLRLRAELGVRRIPAIHTLNKAKQMTASQLEKRELEYAINLINKMEDTVNEGFFENIGDRFSKKIRSFKTNGIRGIKNDVFELNLRLRCADTEQDLMYIIRQVNTNVAILQDYLTEDIPEAERQEVLNTLQELYDIRQKAAKEKGVRNYNDSLINVIYPE